jgi:small ligand-binding sensory domain FIST
MSLRKWSQLPSLHRSQISRDLCVMQTSRRRISQRYFETASPFCKLLMMTPRAASRIFTGMYSEQAVVEVSKSLRSDIGSNASLGFLFVTQEWRPHLEDTLELIRLHAHVPQLVGCSGWGVIGMRSEVEQEPGFSLLLLTLPEDSFTVLSFTEDQFGQGNNGIEFWPDESDSAVAGVRSWIILANPYFGGIEDWLTAWNETYPGIPILGGVASSKNSETFLFRDSGLATGPILLAGFRSNVVVKPLVSQGCRPIGDPSPITKAEENLVLEIGNVPAYQSLESAFLSIPRDERSAIRNNLFLGLAVSEYIEDFKQGDFLIRNILGADPQVGALAVGAYPRVGQTVQFQLRDSKSAHTDLLDAGHRMAKSLTGALGILLFSCAGRGRGLFRSESHDARTLADALGDLPLAGFFCNGEIGPVGSRTYLHGYTASAAIVCIE